MDDRNPLNDSAPIRRVDAVRRPPRSVIDRAHRDSKPRHRSCLQSVERNNEGHLLVNFVGIVLGLYGWHSHRFDQLVAVEHLEEEVDELVVVMARVVNYGSDLDANMSLVGQFRGEFERRPPSSFAWLVIIPKRNAVAGELAHIEVVLNGEPPALAPQRTIGGRKDCVEDHRRMKLRGLYGSVWVTLVSGLSGGENPGRHRHEEQQRHQSMAVEDQVSRLLNLSVNGQRNRRRAPHLTCPACCPSTTPTLQGSPRAASSRMAASAAGAIIPPPEACRGSSRQAPRPRRTGDKACDRYSSRSPARPSKLEMTRGFAVEEK